MQPIGFIGLGIMGKPMARNLLKAGYPLVVYNRSRPAIEALAAEGAIVADSPKAVAQQADVVISCVSDSPDVEAVALGSNGIIEGAKPGSLYIDMSTIAPATARKVYTALKAKGIDALDAQCQVGTLGHSRERCPLW
jgi:2-hydroxy-3-oxopropionate reductase